jgi:hypothetical protein
MADAEQEGTSCFAAFGILHLFASNSRRLFSREARDVESKEECTSFGCPSVNPVTRISLEAFAAS